MPSGGRPYPIEALKSLQSAGEGLPLHMDGARLFNAEVATGIPAATYATEATTVMSCLSKGLCAPVGSVLAGPRDVIDEARRMRARLGGAMRQAGIIAAAGLVALGEMVERLADDHARARRLALMVSERWPDAGLDPGAVATNMVVFRHSDTEVLLAQLRDQGVLAGTIAPGVVRLVTHHDVDDGDLEKVAKALAGTT
ncbi:MAG: beta-eliminating lyase-related protein [Acidimicrobiales bacterium]